MIDPLIDCMVALTALLEADSEALAWGSTADRGEASAEKRRMVGHIRSEVARLDGETPDWMLALGAETRLHVADVSTALRDAALLNAEILREHHGPIADSPIWDGFVTTRRLNS